MAIKNIIAKGIGFSPGTSGYLVTHGFLNLGGGGGSPKQEHAHRSEHAARPSGIAHLGGGIGLGRRHRYVRVRMQYG